MSARPPRVGLLHRWSPSVCVAETDTGEVVVIFGDEGLPADKAGIKVGAVITTWDGKPVTEVAAAEPLIISQSSEHGAKDEQYEFLTRAPSARKSRSPSRIRVAMASAMPTRYVFRGHRWSRCDGEHPDLLSG